MSLHPGVRLSPHFQVREAIHTNHRGHDQELLAELPRHLPDALALAHEVLEPLRNRFGRPIGVNSWFRTLRLNRAISKSAPDSQHMDAQAADLEVSGVSDSAVYNWLRQARLPVGEVILEPSWVHVSLGRPWWNGRREAFVLGGRHDALVTGSPRHDPAWYRDLANRILSKAGVEGGWQPDMGGETPADQAPGSAGEGGAGGLLIMALVLGVGFAISRGR